MGGGSSTPEGEVVPIFKFIKEDNALVIKQYDRLKWARWDMDIQKADVQKGSPLFLHVMKRFGAMGDIVANRIDIIRNTISQEVFIEDVVAPASARPRHNPNHDFLDGLKNLEHTYVMTATTDSTPSTHVLAAWKGSNLGTALDLIRDTRPVLFGKYGTGCYFSREGLHACRLSRKGNPSDKGEFAVALYYLCVKHTYVVTVESDYNDPASGSSDFCDATKPMPLCDGYDSHFIPVRNYGNIHPGTGKVAGHDIGFEATIIGKAEAHEYVLSDGTRSALPFAVVYFTTSDIAMERTQIFANDKLRVNPEDGKAYHELACSLRGPTDVITLKDGRTLNRVQLFVEALKVNGPTPVAYQNLATVMGKDEKVVIDSGQVCHGVFTRTELYIKAIKMAPTHGRAYASLAASLDNTERVTIQSLGYDSPDPIAVVKTYSKRDLYLEALKCDPNDGSTYTVLAGLMLDSSEKITLLDGRVLSKEGLHGEALRCTPNETTYCNVADCLSASETAKFTLHDKRTLNKKQMYVEAIKCNPRDPRAFGALGRAMFPIDKVRIHDGRVMTKQLVFMEAIKCDPDDAFAYGHMALGMIPGETVKLLDGRVLDKQSLYVEAVRCSPKDVRVLTNLGAGMKNSEVVRLADGRDMSKQAILVEAICTDPDFAYTYFVLAESTSVVETVPIGPPINRTLGKKELYVEAIRCDPDLARAYNNLGFSLPSGFSNETVRLHDGRCMSKTDFYVEAIRADNRYSVAYMNLGQSLALDKTVKLFDGKEWKKTELLARGEHLRLKK